MEKQATPSCEFPRLTIYGDLTTITKGQISGSNDTSNPFKP